MTCCCEQNTCCGSNPITVYDDTIAWITGERSTSAGKVPQIATELSMKDHIGDWKVRWGIGRAKYKVNPGIYAVGNPTEQSPVLVSANYKLTFDKLRKELGNLACWVLILDTKGINVWCAAGKGTFGTDELVKRIEQTKLSEIVSHRKLILPQLGAPGVSAHAVKTQTGFAIDYGPVRAADIEEYLNAGNSASEEMRTVTFTFIERLVLTPVEAVVTIKPTLMIFGVLFLLNLLLERSFGISDIMAYIGAILVGTVLTPILLPLIPGRAFAWKGWLLGLLWAAFAVWLNGWFTMQFALLAIGYMLALPAISSYLAMNFTGSSTYTSYSGVLKEMKIAVPLILISLALGVILILIKGVIG